MRTIAIYASAARCTQRASDCYEVNRVRVVPRYAVTVGYLKARRGGTVIGKTHEERGIVIRVHAVQLL